MMGIVASDRALFIIVSLAAHLSGLASRTAQQSAQQQTQQMIASEIARLEAILASPDLEARYTAVVSLAAMESPLALPALEAALKDKSALVRAVAVTGIGQLGDSASASTIAARLASDESKLVRKQAAYALAHLHSRQATPALIAALKDKDSEVRAAAATALSEYADPSAVAPLIESLKDNSEFVRAQAALALGTNAKDAASAVPRLIRLLSSDHSHDVKRKAARTLGLIGDRSALPALNHARFDPDPYLSQIATEAIKNIQQSEIQR
jgi:HEAT repeat protein